MSPQVSIAAAASALALAALCLHAPTLEIRGEGRWMVDPVASTMAPSSLRLPGLLPG